MSCTPLYNQILIILIINQFNRIFKSIAWLNTSCFLTPLLLKHSQKISFSFKWWWWSLVILKIIHTWFVCNMKCLATFICKPFKRMSFIICWIGLIKNIPLRLMYVFYINKKTILLTVTESIINVQANIQLGR